MGHVGRAVKVRSAEDCQKSYDSVKTYMLPFVIQNAWTQPYAQTYVKKLLQEAPGVKTAMSGKLAVVTGVTIGGAGYHMAEELALQAGMHVILLGRSPSKLQASIAAIKKQGAKRQIGAESIVLYETAYDLDALASAKKAADYVTKLAQEKYGGKLHVLLNNAGMVAAKPALTKDGMEANVGRNFVTVHYLTELLLPILKAAATPEYKPRIVDVASIAHIFGTDYLLDRLLEYPKQGGAPEGRIVENDAGGIDFPVDPTMEGAMYQYGRAKMMVVAATQAIQKLHPQLCFTALHPGSIASNFGGDMGIASKVYYWGFYFFQYTPSQGAVASLRACLDPDFNTQADLQGAYLHCDGDPWVPCPPQAVNPATGKPYTTLEWGEETTKVADKLIEKST